MARIQVLALVCLAGCATPEARSRGGLSTSGCQDADGDGFGLYCEAGPDCDETDRDVHEGCSWCGSRAEVGCPCDAGETAECWSDEPFVDERGQEVCGIGERPCLDGAWGECELSQTYPVGDDRAGAGAGLLGDPEACSPCDLQCNRTQDSPDDSDLTDENSEGVVYDDELGGLVIGGGDGFPPYAWIANEGNGTVSKVHQETGAEAARYYTDDSPTGPISPSRTAIDAAGNAYVGNRAISGGPSGWWGPSTRQATVSKYAGSTSGCRNGGLSTSTNWNPLRFGTDDCHLWTAPIGSRVGAMVRAVAISKGDDDRPDGYPWVGTTLDVDGPDAGRAYKLDPDDGTVICSVGLPISAYGATSDGQDPERVWFSELFGGGRLVAVDAETCDLVGTFVNEDPWCGDNAQAYAVTTDGTGRIWQAGVCGDARVFDPRTAQWCYVDTLGYGSARGIAIDTGRDVDGVVQEPRVWLSHYANPSHLSYWDLDEPCVPTNVCHDECATYRRGRCTSWRSVCVNRNLIAASRTSSLWLPGGHHGAWGVGIDFTDHNRVWIVNRGLNSASIYDPVDGSVLSFPSTPANFSAPYTYSDFTGFQYRNFVSREGHWSRDWGDPDVCGPGRRPIWQALQWDAETPAGTHLRFEVQTAATESGLRDADVVVLGESPPETSPPGIDMGAALLAAGEDDGLAMLRIRVVLISDDRVDTPVFRSLDLSWICMDAE